jgi:hypothetical protein
LSEKQYLAELTHKLKLEEEVNHNEMYEKREKEKHEKDLDK